MVDGVVAHVVADLEHRLIERCRGRPAETHSFVAGHVDDEAPRRECRQIGLVEVVQGSVRVLQGAVDHDVGFGEERCEGHPAVFGDHVAQVRCDLIVVELHDVHGVDGRPDGRHLAVGEHLHIVHAMGVERGHGTTSSGSETDHHCAQAATVIAGEPHHLQRMQYRAVPGELVVLVKDMQSESTASLPVVHGLERDEREPFVDGELGHLAVLDTMRPSPQHLPVAKVAQVAVLRFRQQDHVRFRDHLLAGSDRPDVGTQLIIREAEPKSVPVFEHDRRPQVGVDPVEACRMQRQAPFPRLAGAGEHAETHRRVETDGVEEPGVVRNIHDGFPWWAPRWLRIRDSMPRTCGSLS